jgi:micrococcal nuclease
MRTLILFLIFAVSGGCRPLEGTRGYSARVIYVYDGDTVKLDNGEKVRYLGIDTPEMNYKNPPAEFFAEESKNFNFNLVNQKIVRLEFDLLKRDKYDRLLAYVYVNDECVNARLVEEGLAKVYVIPPNVKYADEFLLLQERARQEKKGIWSF